MRNKLYSPLSISFLALISLVPLSACAPKASTLSSSTTNCMNSGDIVVSNSGTDTVIVLDSAGTYKSTALSLNSNSENIYGVTWDPISSRILVVIDGSDRVISISPTDCSTYDFTNDANLNGNVRGITRLASGDVLVVETSVVERFNVAPDGYGIRYAVAGWPKTLQTSGTGISAKSGGGFVECGSTAVRTYDDNGNAVSANTVSGIAGTTAAGSCRELRNGDIAVAWTGTTDTVRIYNSTLGSIVGSFSNTGILASPGGIAQRANGNLLVVGRTFNQIIEMTETGVFVQALKRSVLSTPEFIEVIP